MVKKTPSRFTAVQIVQCAGVHDYSTSALVFAYLSTQLPTALRREATDMPQPALASGCRVGRSSAQA